MQLLKNAPPAVVEIEDIVNGSMNAITAPRVEPWPVVAFQLRS